MSDQIRRVKSAFEQRFGARPEILIRAPGRVALLGAHVDYSDGWVMPAAIERSIYLAASPSTSSSTSPASTWLALDEGEEKTLDHHSPLVPLPERGDAMHWGDLPAGILWALRRKLSGGDAQVRTGSPPEIPALDVVYGGDLPAGAGVSSSAAVAVAFCLAWKEAAGLGLDDIELAQICRTMENGFLGVQSGIMDPFASLFGRLDHAIFLDCRSLEYQRLSVSQDAAVIVFDSGVRRRLAQSGFNDRREECRRAVEILKEPLPKIQALRDVDARDFELHSHLLPPVLRHRTRHAVEEMQRVRDGAEALRRGDLGTFGALMRRSHLSSRDFYEVSIPELDLLAATAWAQPGLWGARMMGGGFGGCVAALVESQATAGIVQAVGDAFERSYGRRPPAFTSSLAQGATSLSFQ